MRPASAAALPTAKHDPIDVALPAEASRSALLGHDLRAAVSDIIGGLRLIDPSGLDESTRLQLERVRTASEVLARLLEDALAAMLGEGTTEASPTSLPLGRLLRDAELRWSGRAREKGLSFEMSTAPDLPRVIRLDRIALERILSNLLSNAIKYTDSGTIGVEVGLDQGDALVFQVRDQGPGIAREPAQLRGKAAKPGSGLGLRIAHEMAERLGGVLSAENVPDGGAVFTLSIPQPAWQPTGETPAALPDLPDLGQMKLLVAEDSETNQALLRHLLTALGAEVQVVGDGIEALNRLEMEAFDAALIDIEMPRLSGIEVMRAIRASGGRHARMPIMAVTAYVLRANREAIYAAGADSILAKPFGGLDSLGAAMATLLDRTRSPEADPTDSTEGHVIDTVRFASLLDVAGPDGRTELLVRLLSDLKAVERGLVAASAEPDFAAIRAQTHVLIAVAGAVGADRLMQAARLLNGSAHRRMGEAVRTLCPEVLAQLDDLIHYVSGHVSPAGEAS